MGDPVKPHVEVRWGSLVLPLLVPSPPTLFKCFNPYWSALSLKHVVLNTLIFFFLELKHVKLIIYN